MIRLTLILAVLIVVAMIVLAPDEDAPQVVADTTSGDRPPRIDPSNDALVETGDGRLALVTATGEELAIDLVIEPASLTAEDARVNLPPAETSGALEPVLTEDTELPADTGETAAEPEAEEPPAELPAETGTLLRVTGDRVNFRRRPLDRRRHSRGAVDRDRSRADRTGGRWLGAPPRSGNGLVRLHVRRFP
jgi:hypothetical protein